MSLYDGTENDINIAGFETTNIALKNTPQQNPKEFKTKTEKQAKENDGKTSSIINLLDEIDTTLYVINDKLDERPEIMLGKGILSGGVLTKEGLNRMKVAELKEELKKRAITFKSNDRKVDLLERLEDFLLNSDRVKKYQPEAEKQEIETQTTEPYTYGPTAPSGMSASEEDEYMRSKQAGEDYEEEEEEEEEEDLARFLPMPPSGPPVLQPIDNTYEDTRDYHSIYSTSDDESDSSDTNAPSSASSTYQGSEYAPTESTYNFEPRKRPNPATRNDLNSNIMKLEEQVNRLSKLTKGINSFINFSNPVEVEKLNNSSKKIVNSSRDLKEHLNDITPINKIFETKMNSIINKIELEYNKINSALNGYTYTFMEGGNMHNNHILDFMNSSKKRFY